MPQYNLILNCMIREIESKLSKKPLYLNHFQEKLSELNNCIQK